MAISSSLPSTFSPSSFCFTRSEPARFVNFLSAGGFRSGLNRRPLSLLTVSSRLNSSKPSGTNGSISPDNGDLQYELQHGFPSQRGKGLPVFVTLPIDASNMMRNIRKWKLMIHSLKALAIAGVEGVVMEVWWGLVEKDSPMVYDWKGYLEIVSMARRCGLKVRAVMAFHQCGKKSGDSCWIPLPDWVHEEMDKDPNLAYTDRFGRRNQEYISLGCDNLPVLKGRSPIQAYSDFMRNFRDTFREFLGVIITGIQVGMGPAGELRYPSCSSQKLRIHDLGEFQCYDKYMLASLNACAQEIEMSEWGYGGPVGTGNLMHDPEQTEFFRSDGFWNTPYGRFFLEWYSEMLLLHGERLCSAADTIFRGTGIHISAKVAGIYWHDGAPSHPSELTAGYYNTLIRDGYLPIARMFGRYGVTLCCTNFEMQDAKDTRLKLISSLEGFFRQLLLAARKCDIHVEGENLGAILDDESLQRVLKMSKFYSDGLNKSSFSFNFMRMNQNLFEHRNWVRFTRFVRQMTNIGNFQAKLDIEGGDICLLSTSVAVEVGAAFAYY
ncbi:hypothetical protein HHK36_001342 [Tetracentron sinense]|uniref:Beta-amylase n=1 Tax=Tetracentron sinense TaxID=13715 RepID=A0A835A2L5_TETSI|nr:hypothetical protein HHK36_001342 [Tetracentron sinense]